MAQLHELCRRHKVERLWAFGSVLTPRFGPSSDVDLLVAFKPGMAPLDYGENFMDFLIALQDLYAREVDLVENDRIENPFFRRNVNRTRRLIYG